MWSDCLSATAESSATATAAAESAAKSPAVEIPKVLSAERIIII